LPPGYIYSNVYTFASANYELWAEQGREIVNEKRAITADTALRFTRYFNNSPTFWMNLQTRYELEVAEDEIADKVERDVRPLEAAPAR
jgi:addiction module HigA family antidote